MIAPVIIDHKCLELENNLQISNFDATLKGGGNN